MQESMIQVQTIVSKYIVRIKSKYSMQRFFINHFQATSEFILKDVHTIHQIITVLRSQVGTFFIFFDGKNPTDYIYELRKISKKELIFVGKDIIHKWSHTKQISLYQALPNKLEKLEYIIQKWTEVGITSFSFFRSERSQKLLLSEAKKERLEKICIEAIEQSGRNTMPLIQYRDTLEHISWETVFFDPSTDDSQSLRNFSSFPSLSFLVWPEWGWSEREIHQFLHLGYKKVSLGDFVLRTETVAPSVVFFLNQV